MSRNYVKCAALGSGSYGRVDLAIVRSYSSKRSFLAVKSCPLDDSRTLQKEDRILAQLRDCPEIVHCYGNELSFENGRRVYDLLLEYASGGSLLDVIWSQYGGRLPEQKVQIYARMIIKGLSSLHERGFVHCDLKPANILVFLINNSVTQLKIADFGLAKEPGKEDENYKGPFRFLGTPPYMSPESFVWGVAESGLDVWSVGCIVLEMMCGEIPWLRGLEKSDCGLQRWLALSNEEPEAYFGQMSGLSEKAKDFLGRCLVRDPRKRWTAHMLLNHPFIVEGHTVALEEACLSSSCSKPINTNFLDAQVSSRCVL